MSELDLNQIETIARNLRAVSDETYSAAVAVADVYNVTSAYDIGDYCIKSTLLYKCNTAIPSGEVWNSNHWDEICVSDELNEIRSSVIHVGTSAPSNPNVQLWLDTDEPGMSGVSSVNGATGTVVLDADDVGAMSKWELLWTNASPTSSFAAQTIPLDLSDYDFVLVRYRRDTSATLKGLVQIIKVAENYENVALLGLATADGKIGRRITNATTTGVVFASATLYSTYGTGTESTTVLIPEDIYGIKGVVTA